MSGGDERAQQPHPSPDPDDLSCSAAVTGQARTSTVTGLYGTPQEALQAAVSSPDPADRIVVFGSFHTVGGVLQDGVPRLQAKHLPS